jgi:hypothetical protein
MTLVLIARAAIAVLGVGLAAVFLPRWQPGSG